MKIIENVRMQASSTGAIQTCRWEAPFPLKIRAIHMILETEAAGGDNGRGKMQVTLGAEMQPDPANDTNELYSAVLAELKCPANNYVIAAGSRPNEVQTQNWTFAEGIRVGVGCDVYLHVDCEIGVVIGSANLIFEREV